MRSFRNGLLYLLNSKVPLLAIDARTTIAKVDKHVSGAPYVTRNGEPKPNHRVPQNHYIFTHKHIYSGIYILYTYIHKCMAISWSLGNDIGGGHDLFPACTADDIL